MEQTMIINMAQVIDEHPILTNIVLGVQVATGMVAIILFG